MTFGSVHTPMRGEFCAIDDLMEDAATAEISRAQVWQWVHHHMTIDDPEPAVITAELVRHILDDIITGLTETAAAPPSYWARPGPFSKRLRSATSSRPSSPSRPTNSSPDRVRSAAGGQLTECQSPAGSRRAGRQLPAQPILAVDPGQLDRSGVNCPAVTVGQAGVDVGARRARPPGSA